MRSRALLLLFLAGCPHERDPRSLPLVEILPAGAAETQPAIEITPRDLKRAIARLRIEREGVDAGPLPKKLKQHVVDQLIDQRILAIEADRLKVAVSTVAVAREIAEMKQSLPPHRFERFLVETYQTEKDLERAIAERLAATQVMARELEGQVEVTDQELEQAWQRMPEEQRVHRARVHAAQIVVPTEDIGLAIVKKLRAPKPADFAELAKANSIAPEAEHGGDLGWFEKGDMPAVFDQVCFSLDPGQISELTASELGYHVFKVIEREAERPMTFEEAKPLLLEQLKSARVRTREDALMKSLASRYRVVRHDDRIAAIE